LVEYAEATDPAKRTTDSFIDAMQLVDRMMTKIPAESARELRDRLREITVRVIKIGTVEEEMRYDVPYFAVEAGRPLQILLENHDLMPHNLVITQPGALKGVAMAGLAAGPEGTGGLPYVPDSPNVIAASEMISPDSSTRITLNAPTEPGEYPYVCTFPQHWYRMYGVMVVVEDLDVWNRNPVEPANPIGSNRSFVQAWTLNDFEGAFETNLRGRSASIGEKIFNEASCIGCHKVKGVGGAVGPELTDTYTKWKSDHKGILREILEPSHKIDTKYAMQTILTVDGKTMSGIVVNENDDTVALLTNPEAKEPVIILQDDIELIKRSATSMMPKALMDQYTKDEVIELMAYLKSVAENATSSDQL
jgi:putative heme-binding domain-containing protein